MAETGASRGGLHDAAAPTTIVIAANQKLVAEALLALISQHGADTRVVGVVTELAELDRLLAEQNPRILVLSDAFGRGVETERIITRARGRNPATRVVLCAAEATSAVIARAHRAGAGSVVELTDDVETLIGAIRSVAASRAGVWAPRSRMFRPTEGSSSEVDCRSRFAGREPLLMNSA